MIRKLVLFGWFALVPLLVAGLTGYGVVPGSDRIPHHLLSALLAFGALGLVFLCVTLYLLGMGRLVRKVSRKRTLENRWAREHRRLAGAGIRWSLVGFALLVASALTGYPTHLGRWEPPVHHVLFYLTFALSVLALWRLGPIVKAEEELVRELDEGLADEPPTETRGPAFPDRR